MILDAAGFAALKGRTTMVAGGFDPLHEGHIAYFNAAAALNLPVVCSVDHDRYIERKHRVILHQRQRAQVIDALKPIAHTYLNPASTVEALQVIRPKIFVKGNDWQGRLPQEEVDVCNKLGIEIRFVPTKINSSSDLLAQLQPREHQALNEFETFVFDQTMPEAGKYDREYFQGAWRAEDRYDLESRRNIEGRHPHVIKEVFSPRRVIDMGCGPGYLMHLLHELDIEADGLDLSPAARQIATAAVRERIKLGSILDAGLPDRVYDLVICREVLEHLPVIDVHRAVQNMCRISSRYVYVTTRFHPRPTTLLDVTNEFHVDPTHITVMNKNLLRLMFILAGFRRREDLESRMDWLKKDRVLVYERVER